MAPQFPVNRNFKGNFLVSQRRMHSLKFKSWFDTSLSSLPNNCVVQINVVVVIFFKLNKSLYVDVFQKTRIIFNLPPFVPRHSLGLKTITSPGSTLKWSKFQSWPNVGKLYGTLVAKNDLTHESESISFRGRSKTS